MLGWHTGDKDLFTQMTTWLRPRRLELFLGLSFMLMYGLAFPAMYQSLRHGALLLVLPGVALLSWALGIWGALMVGLTLLPFYTVRSYALG